MCRLTGLQDSTGNTNSPAGCLYVALVGLTEFTEVINQIIIIRRKMVISPVQVQYSLTYCAANGVVPFSSLDLFSYL